MKIEDNMGSGAGAASQAVIDQLNVRIASLEARLTKLESQPQAAAMQRPTPPPMPSPDTVYPIPTAHSVLSGAKNPKVTLVEFVDFQCPFCARFHDPMVEAAKAFPNEVAYMIKHFPLSFHQDARPAAKAALAAGEQGKFLEMSDMLLDNQQSLKQESFEKFAADLGLNVEKFKNDLKNNDAKYEKIINDDMALGTQVNVRGTPSFYINGKISNSRDAASWKSEIEALLKQR
jgi:protein-disulfide isomerase